MSSPELSRRVDAYEEDLRAISDTVIEIRDDVAEIKTEHGRLLAEHGTMLSEHGTMLSEHGTMLSEHGTKLDELSSKLDAVLTLLAPGNDGWLCSLDRLETAGRAGAPPRHDAPALPRAARPFTPTDRPAQPPSRSARIATSRRTCRARHSPHCCRHVLD